MSVLVSDTSVLIDLERGRLLEEVFKLPFDFAVPDLLYARELSGDFGDQLRALGLRIEALTPLELTRATMVRRQNASLSTPDTFAFAIAEARGWTLLTGDLGLRQLAQTERIAMHGVLWVFDQLADQNLVTFAQLHDALRRIFS
ncbi:MAG: hypothetical protein P1U62_14430, partial [Alteraurantiacibacter sp. bin_em_oilr2.035]|nr:hypothetical protein [Alteraurantiacibacter sp. bin_em_oilr2.035]